MGALSVPFFIMKEITIEENGRKRIVFIPDTGDAGYNEALEQMAKEKTTAELKAMPPKPKSRVPKDDVAGALKEIADFRRRKREGDIKKWY